MCGAAGNVGFHSIRRQLAAPEARGEVPIDDLSAVPADLGSSMRFLPTALLDALVIHEGASLAPGTATIGEGVLCKPPESTGVVAIPPAPRVGRTSHEL